MSWFKWAAGLLAAGSIAVAGYSGLSVSAQEPALDRDQKKMVVDCAAIYRWQGGPEDPSYKRLKGLYQRFSGTGPMAVDQTLSVRRDAFERSIASGKMSKKDIQAWLDTCADFSTLPAPPGPLRLTAFPEQPNPESVTGLLDCLALARWQMGPYTYTLIAGRDRYIAYARLAGDDAEDVANAELRRRVDNIDKALIAGSASLSDLAAAREACQHDYSVVINASDERKMSLEYENEHPRDLVHESHLPDYPIVSTPERSSASQGSSGGLAATDGEDNRLFTSGGVDVTNTTSSSECVSAMDQATRIMQPDLNALTQAMERDRKYCTGDFECTYTANGAAVLACASVNRARGEVPSQCLKERAMLDNLKEQVCPG